MDILGSRRIAYPPSLVRVTSCPLAALFLAQCLYWQGHLGEATWWEKSRDEWMNETGFSRRNIETARKRLRELDLIEERREGVPSRLLYRVKLGHVAKSLGFQMARTEPTSRAEPSRQASANRADTHHQIKEEERREEEKTSLLPSLDLPWDEDEETAPEPEPAPRPQATEPSSEVKALADSARILLENPNLGESARPIIESLSLRLSAGLAISKEQTALLASIGAETRAKAASEALREAERKRAETSPNVPTSEAVAEKLREDLEHDEDLLRERQGDGAYVPLDLAQKCERVRKRLEMPVPDWVAALAREGRDKAAAEKTERATIREANTRMSKFVTKAKALAAEGRKENGSPEARDADGGDAA